MRILLVACLMTLGAAALPAASAHAQDAGPAVENRTPLVIVRFNQRNLSVEKALYNAVSKASEAKPTVMFDVVQRPGLKNDGDNASLNKVAATLVKVGVPQGNITTATGPASGEPFDEVYVYVR